MNKPLKFKSICVIFEKREDGGLRVWSEDVPGFVLSHIDSAAVVGDIRPALEMILSTMFSSKVRVGPLEGLKEDLEDSGFMLHNAVTIRKTYVAELCA